MLRIKLVLSWSPALFARVLCKIVVFISFFIVRVWASEGVSCYMRQKHVLIMNQNAVCLSRSLTSQADVRHPLGGCVLVG